MHLDNLRVIASEDPQHFEAAILEWFWQQFDEFGGCGLFTSDKRSSCDESTLIEESLAKMVHESFPCAPFLVSLFDKGHNYEHNPALRIEAVGYTIWVGSVKGTSLMYVEYSWPEVYTEFDNNGEPYGGTHMSKTRTFDLTLPTSLEAIRQCVWDHCFFIISKIRPKSCLTHEAQFTLFYDQREPSISETWH